MGPTTFSAEENAPLETICNALIAACFAAADSSYAGDNAIAAALPSGTYRYAVHSQGKVTATSTVVIERGASSVTVKETLKIEGETARTTRVLDPKTFSTRSWSGFNVESADTIIVTAKDATYRHANAATTIAAPGNGPAAVYDFFVAEFATLPAMIAATGAGHYNEYCICVGRFQVQAVAIIAPPTGLPPPGVLPPYAAMALSTDDEMATLWYDPKTFLLREFDLPQEQISYVRITN